MMAHNIELFSLDELRERARVEIRKLLSDAKPYEKTNHIRRRLERENPFHSPRGIGVSRARIRRLTWMQVLYDELAIREKALVKAGSAAELSVNPGIPTRKRRERLKLLGRKR